MNPKSNVQISNLSMLSTSEKQFNKSTNGLDHLQSAVVSPPGTEQRSVLYLAPWPGPPDGWSHPVGVLLASWIPPNYVLDWW